MKKKIIERGFIILALAVFFTLNSVVTSTNNNLSDLSLANVEALANSEWTGDGWSCFRYSYDDGSSLFFTYIRCFDCYTSSAVSVWISDRCWH